MKVAFVGNIQSGSDSLPIQLARRFQHVDHHASWRNALKSIAACNDITTDDLYILIDNGAAHNFMQCADLSILERYFKTRLATQGAVVHKFVLGMQPNRHRLTPPPFILASGPALAFLAEILEHASVPDLTGAWLETAFDANPLRTAMHIDSEAYWFVPLGTANLLESARLTFVDDPEMPFGLRRIYYTHPSGKKLMPVAIYRPRQAEMDGFLVSLGHLHTRELGIIDGIRASVKKWF